MEYSDIRSALNGSLVDNLNQEYQEETFEDQIRLAASIPGYHAVKTLTEGKYPSEFYLDQELSEIESEEITVEGLMNAALPEVSSLLLGESFEKGRYDENKIYLAEDSVDRTINELERIFRPPRRGPMADKYGKLANLANPNPYQRGKNTAENIESVQDIEELGPYQISSIDFLKESEKRRIPLLLPGVGSLGAGLVTNSQELILAGYVLSSAGLMAMMPDTSTKAKLEYNAGKDFKLRRETANRLNDNIHSEIGDLDIQVSTEELSNVEKW